MALAIVAVVRVNGSLDAGSHQRWQLTIQELAIKPQRGVPLLCL
ncbi:hypothetical protein O987_07445 [Comamonas testosteroni TK102]|uniref:Uncharacterized protein n=1 Tax=Comamonas testosteroni TK102 TaxID=1392005 RepID=A0A076PLT3_COMTE|nr:hypothetical protein O987_07445 [Comamonas testosteroni TK102]